MLIDWFTVAAQIVNFVILVALMKHYLYAPLVKAIDDREAHFAAQRAEVAQDKRQAELEMRQVGQQISDLENRGTQIIAEARSEGDRKRSEMIETARNSVRGVEQRWRDDLRLEQSTFFNEIRHAAASEILAVTRSVLADLASAEIQRSAVQAFLEKLASFDIGALKKLSVNGLTVATATELPPDLRLQIAATIEKTVGGEVSFRFEQARDMAWGIALQGEGQRIAWTPDAYLDSLEQKLKAALEQHAELGSLVAVQ